MLEQIARACLQATQATTHSHTRPPTQSLTITITHTLTFAHSSRPGGSDEGTGAVRRGGGHGERPSAGGLRPPGPGGDAQRGPRLRQEQEEQK